jgi:hypothetical protein
MNDRVELWCEGLPHVGERELGDVELRALRTRVEEEQRRRQWRHRGLLAVNVVAMATTVAFVLLNPGDQALGLTLAAALGVMFFAFAALGAVYGALLAETPLGRWSLRAGLVGLVLPQSFVFGPVIVLLMGGPAALWFGWKEQRRLRSSFAVVEADLAEGTVLRFEAEAEAEGPQTIVVEVLPRSGLLHAVQGEPAPGWSPMEIQRILTPHDPDDQWPSEAHRGYQLDDASHTYRERAATPAEQDELRRLRRRLIKLVVTETLALAWGAAALVSVLGRLVPWPQLSLAISIVAGSLIVWRAWSHVIDWRRLGRDLAIGRVLRAWSSGADLRGEPDAEFLPCSGIYWTEDGKPSGWRTRS